MSLPLSLLFSIFSSSLLRFPRLSDPSGVFCCLWKVPLISFSSFLVQRTKRQKSDKMPRNNCPCSYGCKVLYSRNSREKGKHHTPLPCYQNSSKSMPASWGWTLDESKLSWTRISVHREDLLLIFERRFEKTKPLTLYTLASRRIFYLLFPMHFLCISYVANKENLVGDHFLYSHDLNIYSAVIL